MFSVPSALLTFSQCVRQCLGLVGLLTGLRLAAELRSHGVLRSRTLPVGRTIERSDVFKEKPDLLLGRKTYEIFAGYWPYYDEDAPHGGIVRLFNDVKKYAVSRSGEVDTSWAGSVLLRDIADVKRRKQEDGPTLVTQGSTELVHALLANDLVDAMSIFTVPVVLGGGKRLFADGSAPHSFSLTRSRVSPNGLIVGHYEREGEIRIGGTAIDSPSDREVARRERMKREG